MILNQDPKGCLEMWASVMVLLGGARCYMPAMPGLFSHNKELPRPKLPVIETSALPRSPLQCQCIHLQVAGNTICLYFIAMSFTEHCLCCRELPCPRLFSLPGGTHGSCLADKGCRTQRPDSFASTWNKAFLSLQLSLGLAERFNCYPICRSVSPSAQFCLPNFITGVSPVNTHIPVNFCTRFSFSESVPTEFNLWQSSLRIYTALVHPLIFQMSKVKD